MTDVTKTFGKIRVVPILSSETLTTYKFDPSIFEKLSQRVTTAQSHSKDDTLNDDSRFFAQHFLDTLASKSGNDTLERVLIESLGRKVKSVSIKHGADSEDSEVEAKPMKSKYNAHISDDTPAILLKNQQIPFIVIAEATEDGTQILWAILLSYRTFDISRFNSLVKELPEEKRVGFKILPDEHNERYAMLQKLRNIWPKSVKIRSNPLPFDDMRSLKSSEYSIWVNPALTKNSKEHTFMIELDRTSILNKKSMEKSLDIRDYFKKMKADDYNEMSATELKEVCRKNNIQGFSNKKKEGLLSLVTKFMSAKSS